jgi:equilibrative nucleoside transporter 1/2/3
MFISGFGSGQPLGGIFVVICSIVSITVSGKANISIAIYFGLAILVIISNIIVYFFLEKTHLFHIYSSAVREINNDHEPLFHEASSNYDDYHHTLSITSLAKRERLLVAYKHIKWQFWGAFLTFVSTFSVFPAYLSKVKSMNQINIHKHFLWPDRLYVPVMTFLLFFLGETIGRIISSKIHIPSVNYQRVLFFICLSRFLFIFLFGFCNLPKPDGYPNIFKHDAIYGVLIVIFAVSHGYCNTLNMIYAPRRVQTQLSGTVGALMMMVCCLYFRKKR